MENIGKSPFSSWVNQLFLWPFSIAFCMFTRPGKPSDFRDQSLTPSFWPATGFFFASVGYRQWRGRVEIRWNNQKWRFKQKKQIRTAASITTDVWPSESPHKTGHEKLLIFFDSQPESTPKKIVQICPNLQFPKIRTEMSWKSASFGGVLLSIRGGSSLSAWLKVCSPRVSLGNLPRWRPTTIPGWRWRQRTKGEGA